MPSRRSIGAGFAPTIRSSASCARIRRRSRVVGPFLDGQSALNLAAARLRYIAGSEWSTKRSLRMELLKDQQISAITA